VRGPLLSVIIPAYDGERFIGEAIESVITQTYEPVELIVIDDGSRDRTAQVAASYPEVRLIRRENGGPAAARNTGFEASSGELLAFHDQDDLMLPRKLEIQVRHLLENPDVLVNTGVGDFVVEDGATLPDWDRTVAPSIFEGLDENTTIIDSISMVMWRSVFERIGPFDASIFAADDLDWLLRASEEGIGIERLDVPVLRRRIHHSNLSQDTETMRAGLLRCFRARVERHRRRATAAG
jgi:glycosyltransferase involved in cell wall biosynthesis